MSNAPQSSSSGSSSLETYSIPSILSVVLAGGSFFVGAFAGFLLAIFAILFGVLGAILAFSPKRRGGCLSTASIILGVTGILAAVVKAFLWLL